MSKIKGTKNDKARRFCRSCCRLEFEANLSSDWTCADCAKTYKKPAMPLINWQGRTVFDTRQVFAGYKIKWIQQGDTRMQREGYIPCRLGVFYACAENTVAFESRSTRAANIVVEEFPQARFFTQSDDGVCCVHLPIEIFDAVAERVGARKKRVLSEEQRQAATERLAAARMARQ